MMLLLNCPKCDKELDDTDYVSIGELAVVITCRPCKQEKSKVDYKSKAIQRELKKSERIMEQYRKESNF